MDSRVSRRDFIKAAGIVAAGVALGGYEPDQAHHEDTNRGSGWKPTEENDPFWWAVGRMRARLVRLELAGHGWGRGCTEDVDQAAEILCRLSPQDLSGILEAARCLACYPDTTGWDAEAVKKADSLCDEWLVKFGYPRDMLALGDAVEKLAQARREAQAIRA